jgi:SAM-dependent methyltransferase
MDSKIGVDDRKLVLSGMRRTSTRTAVQWFFDLNRKLCRSIRAHLPQAQENLFLKYEERVVQQISSTAGQIVLDIGGGKSCPFTRLLAANRDSKIVAVDISCDELARNKDVDLKIAGDLMGRMPLADGSVDLVVSRSVLEHLQDVSLFVGECSRVLKKGGHTIHLLPSKYALFALFNQMLPNTIAKRLIGFFHPRSAGICGFPAFYNSCCCSEMIRLFERNGFRIVQMKVGFDQSDYYSFFLPFYLLSALYEMAVYALGLKNLGAYLLITAQKS